MYFEKIQVQLDESQAGKDYDRKYHGLTRIMGLHG
jgi:hypothetical protein